MRVVMVVEADNKSANGRDRTRRDLLTAMDASATGLSEFGAEVLCMGLRPWPQVFRTRSSPPHWAYASSRCPEQHKQCFTFLRRNSWNIRILQYSTSTNPGNSPKSPTIRENIYTLPNLLTISRIAACPFLAWSICKGDFAIATSIIAYASVTDWVDGYIARKYSMRSVLGTILDPAADKMLVTVLTLSLTYKSLLPAPLAVLIIGRDVILVISAFYYRYISLPQPRTFKRYWDATIPSAEITPTGISKVNTALQLFLMGFTTISPLLSFSVSTPLAWLQWTVAGTTIGSGLSYVFSKTAVRFVNKSSKHQN